MIPAEITNVLLMRRVERESLRQHLWRGKGKGKEKWGRKGKGGKGRKGKGREEWGGRECKERRGNNRDRLNRYVEVLKKK